MNTEIASNDLRYIREVLERTRSRIDPHAWHFVLWGTIVLLWYPSHNLMQLNLLPDGRFWLFVVALTVGTVGSGLFGWRMIRQRLTAANTFISRQIGIIVFSCCGAAILLNIVGPLTGILPVGLVPLIWGFAYAQMAFAVGVVYSREFLDSAAVIFAGCIGAMFRPELNGLILAPCMGLGMIVPGVISELRVRKLRAKESRVDDA
ncbi:MAG: hypothetical protein OXG96_15420 [Acidobacteria bacterium]|nr:hypothetical protein [Acidobacteriota bacterium]